ncbi:MAG: plastocyanin/azurin family copper-binding protein, partial [Chloroflexota bacterium]|nr:plastocyanin/azurin family copper-binding protein [Chloroflexota bacterium]
ALRNLRGFQDLRITVSPAAAGPSQVLVETTWTDREGLASYEETRHTILDLLAKHEDQVVPGSVQVFDMEVVRDTKDVAFRFSLGAAATLVSAFIVGGFMIGAGLTLFGGEGTAAGGGGTPPPSGGFEETGIIPARNIRFLVKEIRLPPNTEVTLTFDNRDPSPPHNIQFHNGDANAPLLPGCKEGCQTANGEPTDEVSTAIATGPIQQKFTFVTPGPGSYTFICVVHPTDMVGTMIVEEGAPVPPGARPAGASSGESTPQSATPTTTS